MRDSVRGLFLTILVALLATGCEVTEEKVELWKGTVNGPKKLAGTVIDPDISVGLRAKAAVALVEINQWDLYRDAFKKMEKDDAAKVVKEMVDPLAAIIAKADEQKKLSKTAVDAKDGLAMVLEYSGPDSRPKLEDVLIKWCIGDYNARAMAGQYNITTIIKKVGPRGAEALIPMLDIDKLVIKHAAELMRSVEDEKVMEKASKHYAKVLLDNVPKLKEIHLETAVIVGGNEVGDALLTLATNKDLAAGLQRFALRAFDAGANGKTIKPKAEHTEKLFAMAENEEFDQYQREETYYTISAAGRKEDLPRIKKLLDHDESFYRMVGLRCVLRMDGEQQLAETLTYLSTSKKITEEDIPQIIELVGSFKKLMPKVKELLDNSSVFVKAIAVGAMGKLGFRPEVEFLKKLEGSNAPLPEEFEHKTLGEAVAAAVEKMKKKG